ncbi:TetR/AcrR family transcriptional regulator [Gordonia humi]|uniref:AcrR family transcriptional regulator n=1 Tax=Gordonia humi TaxID=686429 RepID=A0A840F4D7_9ACTN|nr:AcrR family transcriptional regulator [Gordonia humi]
MTSEAAAQPARRKRGRPPAAGKSKKDLDGGKSRDREVVAAAVRLFYSKGYAATSIQDIADELGLLKGSVYYYIDTKETLLRRIFETSHEQVREIAEKYQAPEDGSALERFRGFLREYALWYLRNIPRASLFAREWRHASDELRAVMLEQRKYYDHALRALILAVGDERRLEVADDASMISNFIMSAVSSLPDWFHPDGSRSAEDVATHYVDYATRVLTGGDVQPG